MFSVELLHQAKEEKARHCLKAVPEASLI